MAAALFGSHGPVTLEDIPRGRFHDQVGKLTTAARNRVLQHLGEAHVPLLDVDSLSADANGFSYYSCNFTPIGAQPMLDAQPAQAVVLAEGVSETPVPISSPPVRHSKPGSTNIIYLDFNGYTITGTAWNDSTHPTYVAKPFDKDGDPTTFNDQEQSDIIHVWERVAEDYRPFDVDVTTELPATFTPTTGRILITPNVDANGQNMPSYTAGGVAYVGVFGSGSYVSFFSPALVYSNQLSNNEGYIAEAASHEMGHNMGLSHDGTTAGAQYYGGHGSGATSWGPIMGTGYGRNVSQWSKGEYYLANNPEDDLAIIAGKVGYRIDDYGDTNATAGPLTVAGTSISAQGIISQTGEADRFSFSMSAGNISITASPYRCAVDTYGGNLDIQLQLIDSTNTVLMTSNPATTTDATIATALAAGTYYLRITGVGVGSPLSSTPDGYTNYASLGAYTLSGTIPVAAVAPAFSSQPSPRAVSAGASAAFSVVTTGSPTPTWQWQRLPFGSGAWSNLSNSGSYSGVTTQTIAVSPTATAMNGDQFHCVATNASGTATSPAATLLVVSGATHDLNGDGKADFIWENSATGDRYVWLMNGPTLLNGLALTTVPVNWRIAAIADFNGDGKADIVWENTTTGEHFVWFMNGTTYSTGMSLGVVPPPWKIATVADFNGDGKTDILWANTVTGEHVIWLMNGTTFSSALSLGIIPTTWHVAGAADFNGDGSPDILWENTTTGERYLWFMNGTGFVSGFSLGIVPTVWRIAATGDFNGDGKPDILWENTTTGERYMWLMNGVTVVSGQSLGFVATVWRITN